MIIAMTLAGLSVSCEKAETPTPASQLTREQVRPSNPRLPSPADLTRKPPTEAERRGPIDRAAAVKVMLAKMESGDFAQAFRYLDEDVVWTEVGLPVGELDTVPELVDYQRRARVGLSDFRLRPSRIIDSADYQVLEYVWSALHTSALADGTPPTGKVATVPGAMLIRYQADGLIDRVWVFQDWPNAVQQLGLAPGLPADFKAARLPDRTELINGGLDSVFAASYRSFASRMRRDAYVKALAEHTSEDFAVINLHSGHLVKGQDAMLAYFGERVGSFDIEDTEIEVMLGAGNFFAAFITHHYTYRGGFMGVLANAQKVTTHTLDVVQYDPRTLRFTSLASYGNSYEILSALGLSAWSETQPEARPKRLGVKACDQYVENARMCFETLEPIDKSAAHLALDARVAHWRVGGAAEENHQELGILCGAALAETRGRYAAACPRVTWD
jgi:hypothetical protein